MKNVKIIVFILAIITAWWSGYNYGKSRIPHLREFQKRIGCTKIDCRVGPEVQRCWQNEWQKQNPGKVMW